MDVRWHATFSYRRSSLELAQFFISDGQLQMPRDDTSFLLVASSIPSQLQNFSRQIFYDSRKVHWSTCSNSLGIVSSPKQTINASNGKH
ncbi:hypothetical protein M513_14206 [Trichuris suis]|uniref:Uncharacterized protein n=1 Tax=Trichuris suis TaxID=68888 RepID=A0A085LIX1_9BILA|nr:hypothetical protein M513_14206 [Trichuris suis]